MLKRHICILASTVLVVGACGSDSDSGEDDSSASTDASADDASTDDASTDDASTDDATTGDAAETPDAQDVEEAVDDLANDVAADAEAAVEDIVDGLEEVQASEGGGGATFSVNGETWEFPSVLCAFGEDEIGQPGGVFNMSAINDGLQLYASIDDSGAAHSLSLNDIEDFENPSVSLAMSGLIAGAFGVSPEFLTLDGKNVSASVVMVDENTNVPTDAPAEFTATCP